MNKANLPVRYHQPPTRLRRVERRPSSALIVRRKPRLLAALWSVDGGARSFLVTGAVCFTAGSVISLLAAGVVGVVALWLGYLFFAEAGTPAAAAAAAPAAPAWRLDVLPTLTPTPLPAPEPADPPVSSPPVHPFFSIEVVERELDSAGIVQHPAVEAMAISPEPPQLATDRPLTARPVAGDISQGFGCSPYYTGRAGPDCPAESPWFHEGVDIAAPAGTPVRAGLAGTVIFAGPDGSGPLCRDHRGYGLAVVVDNGAGWQVLYAHLSRIEVEPGQRVLPDTVVGRVGETGCVSGAHLHVSLRHNGLPVDPEPAAGTPRRRE